MEVKINSKDLFKDKDSATTEQVFGETQETIKLLVEQNRRKLELLERQQAQNAELLQRLRLQKETQRLRLFCHFAW